MNHIYFPNQSKIPSTLKKLLKIFEKYKDLIDSSNDDDETRRNSDAVLGILSDDLEKAGYLVERSKKREDKISFKFKVDEIDLTFEADGFHASHKIAIEVEAGRAWDNKQFLKDIFEASLIDEIEYMVVAVRMKYRGRNDFLKISNWLKAIYASNKIKMNFRGLLLIGY